MLVAPVIESIENSKPIDDNVATEFYLGRKDTISTGLSRMLVSVAFAIWCCSSLSGF